MPALPPQEPDLPCNFGFKIAWWAVRSFDTAAVIDAIGLQNVQPANWETGVRYAYERHVFVTPPLDGWTLIAGNLLPPGDRVPHKEVIHALLPLSNRFGTALVFASHRVVSYCVWAKAVAGILVRGYGYVGESGETFWDEGVMTPEEHQLGFRFFDERSAEATNDAYWEREDLTFADEMSVVDLARAWSVSPWYLEEEFKEKSLGMLGTHAKLLSPLRR